MTADGDRWGRYLASFHTERSGITEDVLGRSRDAEGVDPYSWVAQAVPQAGKVVDVACGSGPLADRLDGGWIGLDRSLAELRRAPPVAAGRLVATDATATPLRTRGAAAAVCSMALMVLDDPSAALAEMARVVRPGGRIVVLLPAPRPLTVRDRARYVRLLAALRLRRLPFPHREVIDDPARVVAAAGLTVVDAGRRRFAYPITGPDDAGTFVRSLYVPDVTPRRLRAATRVAHRWAGSDIGVPLCRLVAATPR